jgi:hypothetical protein
MATFSKAVLLSSIVFEEFLSAAETIFPMPVCESLLLQIKRKIDWSIVFEDESIRAPRMKGRNL